MSSRTDRLRGIYAMLCAAAIFSLMDTVMKLLAAHYPPMQVTALRGLTSLPLVCLYLGWRGGAGTLLKVRWSLQGLRGALGVTMLTLFAYGLKRLSLAEAYAIFFIAPTLITALSVLLLKEQVDAARWGAIGVGLAGVLVVLRPVGGGLLTLGALAVLGAAACYAVSAIAGRVLSRTDASASMVFWLMLMMSAGGVLLGAPGWLPIRPGDYGLLVGLAASGFLGQLAVTEAFRLGDASTVAPFEYSALAWGVALDWLLWRTLPDRYTVLGAAIIMASGVYLVRREALPASAPHP
ncbi:MAG: DMT family transporter [Pseudomonadota bacterium]